MNLFLGIGIKLNPLYTLTMRSTFPLFQSHLDLSKNYWEKLLIQGDVVIDATCGNGKDCLAIAKLILPSGKLYALDIQKTAIDSSKALLKEHLNESQLAKIDFICQSHEYLNCINNDVIKAAIYNLGYLPGGNKQITTEVSRTLKSVEKALSLICHGGFISITCYPGHPEGKIEENALINFCQKLPPTEWSVCYHQFLNRKDSPSLIFLQKSCL